MGLNQKLQHKLLAGTGLGTKAKRVFWCRLILNFCMLAELVMLVLIYDAVTYRIFMIAFQVYAAFSVSFGNLQIPVAAARVFLAQMRLVSHDYGGSDKNHESKINLAPSLDIFYGMVLGQGLLYLVACLLEIFSIIPRRSLARQGGFRGHRGVESINLYYAYALEKCMEKDVLALKQISLGSFAIQSISSDSPKLQLHGVWMMYNLLHKEPMRSQLLSKLQTSSSRDAVARLINMLEWRSPEDTTIRLFAAKVIAVLAGSIQVITIPGALQSFSALLDVDSEPERGEPLLFADHEQPGTKPDRVTADATSNIQEEGHGLVLDDVNHSPVQLQCSIQMQQVGGIHYEHNSCLLRWVSDFWAAAPPEEPLTDHDILPALGMSIFDSLTSTNYDLQNNCLEISKAAEDLIPKIIRFTCYRNGMQKQNTNEAQRRLLMGSSLKLLERLSSIGGKIGITLRHRLTEHPILLRNLAAILDDRFSSQQVRKLATSVLRNLAIDRNACQEIGQIKLIIRTMMDAFLSQAAHSGTDLHQHVQKVAGQALAVLTMESSDNCAAILMERGNFIGELTSMLRENRHIYETSNLLQNLLLHIQPNNLTNSNLRELVRSTVPKVLRSILETEGEELEVLIGLSSQICKFIPEDFAQELENSQRKERFLEKLVNTLEANMNPTVHCPRIRRVIIEQAIYLMEYSCQYAHFFNKHSMMEALLMVEQTPSTIERYRIFLGSAGVMEHKESLIYLVATAKELMCRQWLRGIN